MLGESNVQCNRQFPPHSTSFKKFSDFYNFLFSIFQVVIRFFDHWHVCCLCEGVVFGGAVGSTSPSGGNQVDGLPPASSNTGAVSASWSPKKC